MTNTEEAFSSYKRKENDAPDWLDQLQPCVGTGGLERTHSKEEKIHNSQAQIIRRKTRRKEEGPLAICCGFVVQHQIGLSANLLILLALTHFVYPRARRHTRKFFALSYYNEQTGEYRAGWDDAWMVLYWIVVFTGLRAAVLDYVLQPLAQLGGISKKGDRTRFAEQAWLLIYYSVFWTLGMYILYNSDYWMNLRNLWTNWPNREIGGLPKWYILVQFAFWLQQILVINIEKKRKDHWQMFSHHIITCSLIFNAYGYHQTKVANLILCIMDIVDIFLPVAKCLKYLGYNTACDWAFGVFMSVWVGARHVVYLMVCYSVYHDLPIETNYGCYKGRKGDMTGPFPAPDNFKHLLNPFTDPEGVVCFNNKIKWAFLTPLLILQCITIMWFYLICRVAYRVIRGGDADDIRSDDEEEYEEIEEAVYNGMKSVPLGLQDPNREIHSESKNFVPVEDVELAPLEEEVGVESINLKSRVRSSSRAKQQNGSKSSRSSGVHIPGNLGRKELLDRIGCEKTIE